MRRILSRLVLTTMNLSLPEMEGEACEDEFQDCYEQSYVFHTDIKKKPQFQNASGRPAATGNLKRGKSHESPYYSTLDEAE